MRILSKSIASFWSPNVKLGRSLAGNQQNPLIRLDKCISEFCPDKIDVEFIMILIIRQNG